MKKYIIDTRKGKETHVLNEKGPVADIHHVVEYLLRCGFLNVSTVGVRYRHLWNSNISTTKFDIPVTSGISVDKDGSNGYLIKINKGECSLGVRPAETFDISITEGNELLLSIGDLVFGSGYDSYLDIVITDTVGVKMLNITLWFNAE